MLSQPEFEAAVRDALRNVARSRSLTGNPLLRSRVVVERAAGRPPADVLKELLVEAADRLTSHPRDEKLHRAVFSRGK